MNGNEQGFPKAKKDMEISARRWKTTYGESDNFDLLFTYQYAKKQRIWKYRQEDEKQQMVEVTILIYGVHAIISFSHKYIYQDAKSNDEFSMNVYDKNKQQMVPHIDLSWILRYMRESLIRTSSILTHTLNR